MKKKVFSLFAVALSAFAICLTACEDEESSCTCTETDYEGYNATKELNPESFGAKNCSDLAVKLKMQADGEFDYSCN